ncbi:hypothetical protein NW754_004763 [Fusarium falciforme]|uniref:Uncharacterized protein n=1 Tax=Fusarium falciforme TaxID=195108 RepID=A0A9W8UYV1_9HYPO|nr:hypothetical protein NW754_004763 [Fusarium falciforme]KAJ4186930.1 hypothetical protein NW755_007663 [Fusarium falciforme]KAJ4257826.1 hypothetical protein NW757_003452 [Fusarium falciforme]
MVSSKLLTSTLTLLAAGLAHASKCYPYPVSSAGTKPSVSLPTSDTSTLLTIATTSSTAKDTTSSISSLTTSETTEAPTSSSDVSTSSVSSSTTSVAPPEPQCTDHPDCLVSGDETDIAGMASREAQVFVAEKIWFWIYDG